MPRRRRNCPICNKKNLAKLSNHLADIHQLSEEEIISLSTLMRNIISLNPDRLVINESRKRMRSESGDEMSNERNVE